ncbi:serine/threonine protein phosphatase [Salipiger sp. IMCC34102]|uniref:metallophosphoesterase n=1 Tax=Salipiger sp. IMCC34102 TaxID=2510647 RepID=UPI00101D9CD6|nr:metallophosphoesterase [Salipiger sp. IMCC34102]RYH04062.1 serine/threonine protein phosphatase [Salipiger sp. IMCC34102]
MLYALGDIHGQKAMLDRAFALIAADGGADAPHVFLGDYVDRGPDSHGVIEALIAGRDAGRDWTFIKGNHDRMFLRFVEEGETHDAAIKSGLSWLNPRLGGPQTLASYGVNTTGPGRYVRDERDRESLVSMPTDRGDVTLQELVSLARDAVPETHRQFLATCPLTHQAEEHLFVHAGLRPGVALAEQVEDDLVWIRDGWLDSTVDHGQVVVHGHTALDAPTHFGNRIDLDAGAGYGKPLIPAVLDDGKWFTLTDAGRVPLTPA